MSVETMSVLFQNFNYKDGGKGWIVYKDQQAAQKMLEDKDFLDRHGAIPVGELQPTEVLGKNRRWLEEYGWMEGYCEDYYDPNKDIVVRCLG